MSPVSQVDAQVVPQSGLNLGCIFCALYKTSFSHSSLILIDGINAIAWKLNNLLSQPCLFCVCTTFVIVDFGLTQLHRHATQAKISMAICEATTAEPKPFGGAAIVVAGA